MFFRNLGLIAYGDALEYQYQLFNENVGRKLRDETIVNMLILCEHPHTITIGSRRNKTHLLCDESYLREIGVELHYSDRGGDITYHGPGQLVAYPILDIEKYGIKGYIYKLEEFIIQLLASFGLKTERLDGYPGVWMDTDKPSSVRKICAIGIRCNRYITMHGFALNINNDLSFFSLINPCGFVDKGVTSLSQELGYRIDISEVKKRGKEIFNHIFDDI